MAHRGALLRTAAQRAGSFADAAADVVELLRHWFVGPDGRPAVALAQLFTADGDAYTLRASSGDAALTAGADPLPLPTTGTRVFSGPAVHVAGLPVHAG